MFCVCKIVAGWSAVAKMNIEMYRNSIAENAVQDGTMTYLSGECESRCKAAFLVRATEYRGCQVLDTVTAIASARRYQRKSVI